MLNQGAGQHDALVGLQGQLDQRMHRLPIVAHGERLEAEHCLQFYQVLAPGLLPLPVVVPAFERHFELRRHDAQQGRKWQLISAQDDAGESQVAKLNGEAQPIRRATVLSDD